MSPLPPAAHVRPRTRALAALVLLASAGVRALPAQAPALGATATLARDSVPPRAALERALASARRQERSGRVMLLAGVAGVVGSSAAWVGQGRMGMSGGQAALYTGSTGLAVAGAARWVAGRARAARARADVAHDAPARAR